MSEPSKHAQACSINMPKISYYALLYKTLELIQQAWFCLHPKYWLLDVPSNAPHLPFLHPFIPPLEHLRGIEHIKKGKPRLSLLKGVAASLGNHRDTWCTSLSLSLSLFFIFWQSKPQSQAIATVLQLERNLGHLTIWILHLSSHDSPT